MLCLTRTCDGSSSQGCLLVDAQRLSGSPRFIRDASFGPRGTGNLVRAVACGGVWCSKFLRPQIEDRIGERKSKIVA